LQERARHRQLRRSEANASCGTSWFQCKALGLLVFYTPIGRLLNQRALLYD